MPGIEGDEFTAGEDMLLDEVDGGEWKADEEDDDAGDQAVLLEAPEAGFRCGMGMDDDMTMCVDSKCRNNWYVGRVQQRLRVESC
jgi:hypothetical protein